MAVKRKKLVSDPVYPEYVVAAARAFPRSSFPVSARMSMRAAQKIALTPRPSGSIWYTSTSTKSAARSTQRD